MPEQGGQGGDEHEEAEHEEERHAGVSVEGDLLPVYIGVYSATSKDRHGWCALNRCSRLSC